MDTVTDMEEYVNLLCLQTLSTLLLNTITNFQNVINHIRRRRLMLIRFLLKRRLQRLRYFQLTSATVAAVLRRTHGRKRRFWMKRKVKSWWDNELTTDEWLENFRMTEKTFNKLCDILKSDMKPHSVTVREPIPLRKRIAIALYKIGTCADYRTVAAKFGIHKSSVHNCLYKFCEALIKHFDTFIRFPDRLEMKNLSEITGINDGICKIWGLLDLTHIHISCPIEENERHTNFSGWQSYVLQAVIDSNYSFRWIHCNIPGSQQENAFKLSNIYCELKNLISNDEIDKYYIVGCKSHCLNPEVVKECEDVGKLEIFRYQIQRTFQLLKYRWRICLGRIDVDYSFAPTLIAVCCILHNFCILENDEFCQRWNEGVDEMENSYPQPKLNNDQIGIL